MQVYLERVYENLVPGEMSGVGGGGGGGGEGGI